MNKKTYTLTIGAHEITLKFNMGTLVFMKQATGREPFEHLKEIDEANTVDYIEFTKAVVHAGMLANKSNGIDITDGFYDLSFKELSDILAAFTAAYTVAGESDKDTQQEQAA